MGQPSTSPHSLALLWACRSQAAGKSKAARVSKKAPLGSQPVNAEDSEDDELVQNGRRVEDVYKKMNQLEHILLRPDTYIGSTEKLDQQV